MIKQQKEIIIMNREEILAKSREENNNKDLVSKEVFYFD